MSKFQTMSDRNFKIEFSDKAFEDIHQIQTYTLLTFGSAQKDIYQQKLDVSFKKIAFMPSIGHTHKQLPKDLKIYNVERHIVVYRVIEDESIIIVVRILHQKVNLSSVFD